MAKDKIPSCQANIHAHSTWRKNPTCYFKSIQTPTFAKRLAWW